MKLGRRHPFVSRRAWYLTVALAFAVHNAEEASAAARMLGFMQSSAPIALRAFYEGINTSELRASLMVVTLLGAIVTACAVRSPQSSRWAYTMLVFAAVLGLNSLAHVALAGIARSYMPGLVTSLTLTLPVAVIILVRGRREEWVSSSAYWTALSLAVVIHGPVLALFIRTTVGGLPALTLAR